MAPNETRTASWWSAHSHHSDASQDSRIRADYPNVKPVTSTDLSPATNHAPYARRETPRLATRQSQPQRLFRHRHSDDSHSTATSPGLARSGTFNASPNPNFGLKSPLTPHQDKTATLSPTPLGSSAPSANPAISFADLAEIWSHAIHLASTGRNQTARVLFTHLLSRSGVPARLVALLPLNAGILMLLEEAYFPALHTFLVTARDLCPSGPLVALTMYLMGTAAWDVGVSMLANAETSASDTSGDVDAIADILSKARLFFAMCLEEMADADVLKYTDFGLKWQLERRMVTENVNTCEAAVEFRQIGRRPGLLSQIVVHHLPGGFLFFPMELATETLQNCTARGPLLDEIGRCLVLDVLEDRELDEAEHSPDMHASLSSAYMDPGGARNLNISRAHDIPGSESQAHASHSSGDRPLRINHRLMKELPPIPKNERRFLC